LIKPTLDNENTT